MTQIVKSAIDYHNNTQLDYFGQRVKSTMRPVDSNYVRKHIQRFLKFSEMQRDEDILEVGCGMGKFTFHLLRAGYKVTGLDLSPFLLQKLLEHNNNRFKVPLICSDILEISSEYDGRYDRVIGFFTLHHFHHLETYFQAMSRVLKPGGEIIFIEPNAYNILYYFQIFFTPGMSWKGDRGVAQMRRSNFEKAAKYANLTLKDIHTYGFFPPQIVNKDWGLRIDDILERQRLLKPVLPFQIIRFSKGNE